MTPVRRTYTEAHRAAALWRERCLLHDGSLLGEEPLWTQRLVLDLHERLAADFLADKRPFLEKLRTQLQGATPATVKLAAEMLYVLYLFPSSTVMGGEAKREIVQTVWSWSGATMQDASLLSVLDSGVGHPGGDFVERPDRELAYFIEAMIPLKQGEPQEGAIPLDPWDVAGVLERAAGGDQRAFRHILLNLLFPDTFAGIVSAATRGRIIAAFAGHLEGFAPEEGDTELMTVDRQLLHVRERLESEMGRPVDFYDDDVRARWEAGEDAVPGNGHLKGSSIGGGPGEEEAVRQETTPEPPRSTIARLLHDHIGPGLTLGHDQLGVADDVKALCSVLMARQAQPPISVGLFGDWGTGKSFFMELMHGYVEAIAGASQKAGPEQPGAFCSHVVQIRFNAWHYMDSNLWASLATRVFEGLAEHVSRHTEAAVTNEKLFEELAASEGLLAQVRTERDRANAELSAARQAKAGAVRDRERAGEDRAAAAGRREKAQKDQEELQGTIEELATKRKDAEETLGRSVSVVVQAALEGARQDPGVVRAMDEAAEALRIEPERLRVEDLRQMQRQMRGVGGRLRTLGMALGSPRQRAWRLGAIGFVLAAAVAITLVLQWMAGWPQLAGIAATLLASAGTAAAALERWVGRLHRGIGAVERANGLVQDRITARTAGFREEAEKARATLVELAERERQALADERAARDEEWRALEAERTAREIEQMARADERAAAAAELLAQQRVNDVQKEIAELRAGRRLESFIQERSGAADYREHLGLVSIIRKDFEKLSTLLTAAGAEAPEQGLPHIDRIILYIDDLDRCPESRVVEVLQAVHLLLAFPLFVVVMGVDSRWLLRSLDDHYAALRGGARRNGGDGGSTPHNYLEKIFQIPFTLAPMEGGGFGRLMQKSLAVRRGAGPEERRDAAGTPAGEPNSIAGETIGRMIASGDDTGDLPAQRGERQGDDGGDANEAEHEEHVIDLAPQGLEIEEWEMEFLSAMHPLIGSPRSAKRFVNIYQFIRARLDGEALKRFRGTRQGGEHQAVAMLLAALVGHPRECQPLFDRLMDAGDGTASWWKLVEDVCAAPGEPDDEDAAGGRGRLAAAFRAVKPAFTAGDDLEPFRAWAPAIKRFSFRFVP